MKLAEHSTEAVGGGLVHGRVCDEMVVIREHRPRFERPAELLANGEQTPMQHSQPLPSAKMMLSQVSSDSDEVGALFAQAIPELCTNCRSAVSESRMFRLSAQKSGSTMHPPFSNVWKDNTLT